MGCVTERTQQILSGLCLAPYGGRPLKLCVMNHNEKMFGELDKEQIAAAINKALCPGETPLQGLMDINNVCRWAFNTHKGRPFSYKEPHTDPVDLYTETKEIIAVLSEETTENEAIEGICIWLGAVNKFCFELA